MFCCCYLHDYKTYNEICCFLNFYPDPVSCTIITSSSILQTVVYSASFCLPCLGRLLYSKTLRDFASPLFRRLSNQMEALAATDYSEYFSWNDFWTICRVHTALNCFMYMLSFVLTGAYCDVSVCHSMYLNSFNTNSYLIRSYVLRSVQENSTRDLTKRLLVLFILVYPVPSILRCMLVLNGECERRLVQTHPLWGALRSLQQTGLILWTLPAKLSLWSYWFPAISYA
jgi:hypothetical protein